VGFFLFLPETVLLVGALGALTLSILERPARAAGDWAVVVGVGGLVAAVATLGSAGEPFHPGIYRVDLFSQLLKTGLALAFLLASQLGRDPRMVRDRARVDVPFFLMLATVGMMMLVSATELVTFYVALELAATGVYVAVGVHRDPQTGGEAAAKFIVFGVVTSAVTLYGLSLVLGATGATLFPEIAAAFAAGGSELLAVGLLLVLAGLFFKLALFPFHFWVPDVYQRAPQTVVAFVATASKLAAVGIVLRIVSLGAAGPAGLERAIWILAVLSMTVGNLAALGQRDVKRLLGYSAAAHAGYLMLAVGGASETGVGAALFYGFAYVFMTALVFVLVVVLDRDGRRTAIEDLNGLHERSPGLAFLLLVAVFALAGIPPTVGFAGKWFVFAAALEHDQFLLVLIAAINSTIALYYYLRLVKAAYLEPADGRPTPRLARREWTAGVVGAALTLLVGIWPGPLWEIARAAARVLGS
jgi:NADH-quinone oxidoreductase subunit N